MTSSSHQLPYSDDPRIEECLRAVQSAAFEQNARDRALRFLVTTAKAQGATWAQIGYALGVTRQAAQQRYGD